MEAKARAFVEAFGATLFAQWEAQPPAQRERFWRDAAFVQRTLEGAVAALPQQKLRGLLRRDLAAFASQLATQLETRHAAHVAETPATEDASRTLLNEEDVERALAGGDQATLAVLAREDAHATRIQEAVEAATSVSALVALAGECVAQLRVVRARRFESSSEREGVEAFYLAQVAACVARAAQRWCDDARGRWSVASSAAHCAERESLRALLQSLVAADAVASSAKDREEASWSAFFRPQQSKLFHAVDVTKARAGVYGALLALAVAFPVVYEDDDSDASAATSSDDDSSSDDSDSDSPTNRRKTRKALDRKKKRDHEDCAALAAHVARQIVLAAKRERDASDWYLAVLAAFHGIAQPTQFVYDEDEDEDDEALTAAQQKALHDARAELYARAFASSASLWTQRQHAPLALLEALLCLRHAAEFMRVERKQTVPAVATATTQLAGVALPAAFWKWMAHVKKLFAGEHAAVQSVMKKLSKSKSEKKTANVLLHESVLSLAELRVVVERFELFLAAEKERAHFVVAHAPTAAVDEADASAPDQALFFEDNAGGHSKKPTKQKRGQEETATEDAAARKRGRPTHA